MVDSVLNYLDGYCERAGDSALFAEPLNAVTNVFFIVAAVAAAVSIFRHSRESGNLRQQAASVNGALDSRFRGNGGNIDLWLLAAALFAIGIGSGLWHMHPTGTTVLMDVIPITLFINIYLVAALRHLYELKWRRVFGWWMIYMTVTVVAQIYLPPGLFHGTVMYLPTYATMVAMTFTLAKRDHAMGRVFALVTTVWSASLIFRTVDLEVCAQLSIGTHFLWHTLNAWVLWRLLKVLIDKRSVLTA